MPESVASLFAAPPPTGLATNPRNKPEIRAIMYLMSSHIRTAVPFNYPILLRAPVFSFVDAGAAGQVDPKTASPQRG